MALDDISSLFGQEFAQKMAAMQELQSISRTPLHLERLKYKPRLPKMLQGPVRTEKTIKTSASGDAEIIQSLFPLTFGQEAVRIVPGEAPSSKPLRIGVLFSGGPAPGGHNVIAGLYDYLSKRNPMNKLIGFTPGPKGLIQGKHMEIDAEKLAPFRNFGGFHLIGSDRTKIETDEQFASVKKNCESLDLDGVVVIGGDDSNTNAGVLAEYFAKEKLKTKVIGVPKTIDGDLRNEYVETSFGYDSACKVYAEQIGNLSFDAMSARNTYHFCRLMGREASHILLEAALETHPNFVIVGEEVKAKNQKLSEIASAVADMVVERNLKGLDYGVVVLSEGFIDFLPDVHNLIEELNELMAHGDSNAEPDVNAVAAKLSAESAKCFSTLPSYIQLQLLADRDPHGNVQVSKIESDKLLADVVADELKKRKKAGTYKGAFRVVPHFLGYEARCGFPSNFDCNYCYTLGQVAAILVENGQSGVMATVNGLTGVPEEWTCGGMPITHMMRIERRSGKNKPVIRKALVELDGRPFKALEAVRQSWILSDKYQNPGPIQFQGAAADIVNFTLRLNMAK